MNGRVLASRLRHAEEQRIGFGSGDEQHGQHSVCTDGGALAVTFVAGTLVLHIVDGGSLNPHWRAQALNGVLYGCLGAYIAARRPAQRLGWLLVVAGVGYALTSFSSHYGLPVDAPPYQRPLAPIVVWVGGWTWAVSLGLTTNFALLLV